MVIDVFGADAQWLGEADAEFRPEYEAHPQGWACRLPDCLPLCFGGDADAALSGSWPLDFYFWLAGYGGDVAEEFSQLRCSGALRPFVEAFAPCPRDRRDVEAG